MAGGSVCDHQLLEARSLRFEQLRRKIPYATKKVLTKQLRELEASKIISRKGIRPEIAQSGLFPDRGWIMAACTAPVETMVDEFL
jgi:hypothetical protein